MRLSLSRKKTNIIYFSADFRLAKIRRRILL